MEALLALQRVKLRDKVVIWTTLFLSGRRYYPRNIRILWKYPRLVGIIRISQKNTNVPWILSAFCEYICTP